MSKWQQISPISWNLRILADFNCAVVWIVYSSSDRHSSQSYFQNFRDRSKHISCYSYLQNFYCVLEGKKSTSLRVQFLHINSSLVWFVSTSTSENCMHHIFLDCFCCVHMTFGGGRDVMVIVVGIGHDDTSSNPGLIALHIALIPLGKVWIQLFSL